MKQAFAAKSPEVISGLLGGIGLSTRTQLLVHGSSQILVAETVDQVSEEAEGQHQGHHSRIAKTKPRGFLTVLVDGRLHHTLNAVGREPAVLAHPLDFQKPPVDLASDLLEIAEVGQTLVDVKISRVAKRPFGAQGTPLFEVLFQIKALVLDVQAWQDPS